jgi:hypothetical protein
VGPGEPTWIPTTPDATTSPGDTTARARLFGGNRMKLGVMAFTAGRTARFNSIDFDVERPYDGRPFDGFILDNPLKLRRRGIPLQETTQAVRDFARLGECLSNSGPQNCVRKCRCLWLCTNRIFGQKFRALEKMGLRRTFSPVAAGVEVQRSARRMAPNSMLSAAARRTGERFRDRIGGAVRTRIQPSPPAPGWVGRANQVPAKSVKNGLRPPKASGCSRTYRRLVPTILPTSPSQFHRGYSR